MQSEQLKSVSASNNGICAPVKPSRKVPHVTDDICNGLLFPPRSLPPKYFYDERGARLFEQICQTPEYYPYRSELAILQRYSQDIISQTAPAEIMELGNGNSEKTRLLFDACEQLAHVCSYAPLDICEAMLEDVTKNLQSHYSWLKIMPMLGDYHAGLKYLPQIDAPRLYVFLGGTIGNFYPHQVNDFINEIKSCMRASDYLLLGADRVKDSAILNAAYNDTQGLTAEFNLNMLNVINNSVGSDFDTANFQHLASFNAVHNRMEMDVICEHDHTVNFRKLNKSIGFHQGDRIRTEVSYKFTATSFENLLLQNGFHICQHYQADNGYYSLTLVSPSDG